MGLRCCGHACSCGSGTSVSPTVSDYAQSGRHGIRDEAPRSASDDRGHLVLFLHAHLPYVRHPEEDNVLAEDWFYEAVTETYIPLLALAEGWLRDGVPARLTLSLSPPLLEMLRDDLLVDRYINRLHVLLELAESEVRRTRDDERFRVHRRAESRETRGCFGTL